VKPGFLVVNKPAGVTSHDVIAAVRAVTGIKKVGHTGTLDPFATGVLPVALNATKLIQYLDESLKVYDATIALGSATDTGDYTGTVIDTAEIPTHSREEVEQIVASFVGDSMQTPPPYSAVKVKGKRLYEYARAGISVEVPARPIKIYAMSVLSYTPGELRVELHCSRGTYARVIADDVAKALGSRGHLSALQRERSGPFGIAEAVSFEQLNEVVSTDPSKTWREVMMTERGALRVKWNPRPDVQAAISEWVVSPLDAFSNLPIVDLTEAQTMQVRKSGTAPVASGMPAQGTRFVYASGSEFVAIAEVNSSGPKVVRLL
jgi:tRNA pseudouridine55 synthase